MTSSIQEQTDNVIVVICIALIAATAVLFQSIPTYSDALKFTLIVSLSALTFCLLFSLWHKVRWPKRDTLFRAKLKEHTDKMHQELGHFYEITMVPIAERMLKEQFAVKPPNDPAELNREIEAISARVRHDLEPVSSRLLQSYSGEFQSIRDKTLNAPLDEKWARFKFLLDYLANKTRVFLFVVGLLLFLASIILRIISSPQAAKVVQ